MRSVFTTLAALFFISTINAQNVGIGTTNPTSKLEVVGKIKADSVLTPKIQITDTSRGTGKVLKSDSVGRASWGTLTGIDILSTPPPAAGLYCPLVAGSVATGSGTFSVTLAGNYAYVVNLNINTMQVINISNPVSPVVVGSVVTGAAPRSVAVAGNYAYVVNLNGNTMQVINISNPASPSVVGSASTGNLPVSIALAGNYAYVLNAGSNNMQVINISNPASPVLVTSLSTGNDPSSIAITGSYAYVTNKSSSTMQLINISNPASPIITGSVATANGPGAVTVAGNYAYVVHNYSTVMQVINIGNPAFPVVVGSVVMGNGNAVAVAGNYAYVVGYLNYLPYIQVINISNPLSPIIVGSVQTGNEPNAVAISGNYAYVSNSNSNTVQAINLLCNPNYIVTVNPGTGQTTALPLSWNTSGLDISNANAGYVGIGTNSPTEKLDVNGNIKTAGLQITNGAHNGYYLRSDYNGVGTWTEIGFSQLETDPKVGNLSAHKIPRWGGSTLMDGLLFDNGFSIGMGTNSPEAFLHLQAANADDIPRADIMLSRYWNSNIDTRASAIFHYNNTSSNSDNLAFGVSGNGGSYTEPNSLNQIKMLIQANGNVGIGTTTPKRTLTIKNDKVEANAVVAELASGNNTDIDFHLVSAKGDVAPISGDVVTKIGLLYGDDGSNLNSFVRFHKSSGLTGGFLSFSTNTDIERMRVDADGNVGIGTTNPLGKLHIASSGNAELYLENTYDRKWSLQSNLAFGPISTSFQIIDRTLNISRFGIDNNGNVGIGTTTPSQKLDVNGTTKTVGLQTNSFQIVSTNTNGYILKSDATGNASWVLASSVETDPKIGTLTNNKIPKWNGTTLADGLVFDNGTNVGIGTLTPAQKLEVNGTTKTTGLQTNSFQIVSTNTNGYILKSDATGNASWVLASSIETDPKIGTLTSNKIPKWNGTTLADGLVFDDGTNIGIGTLTPAQKLEVNGTTKTTGLQTNSFQIVSTNTNGYILRSDATGNASWALASSVETDPKIGTLTSNKIPKWNGITLADGLVFDDGTNIGIGTITPSQKLDVNGTTKTIGLQTNSFQIVSTNTNGYILKSDATGNASWVLASSIETDPKIGTLTSNKVPKWNGTTLADGLVFDNGTNVGIGTATPASKLSVSGNSDISGTLGIGTISPIQTLDVNGRLRVANGVIQNGTTAVTGTADLGLYSQISNNWMRFVTNNGRMQFFTENGGGGIGTTPKMVLDESGNLGIGTDVPAVALEVNGAIKTKYSGTATVSVTIGVTTPYQVTIPTLPAGWDYTNTVVLLSAADGAAGNIQKVKLTSLTNIDVYYQALQTASVRFNWIIFKM